MPSRPDRKGRLAISQVACLFLPAMLPDTESRHRKNTAQIA
jgi:hypothetical protein